MTRNEELAAAFEAAAHASNPYQNTIQGTTVTPPLERAIISNVLWAIGQVYRTAAKAEARKSGDPGEDRR